MIDWVIDGGCLTILHRLYIFYELSACERSEKERMDSEHVVAFFGTILGSVSDCAIRRDYIFEDFVLHSCHMLPIKGKIR